jgi:hypothetical protein
MGRAERARWIAGYYLATPAFAAADLVFGANVRAVGLADHPEWRAAWYAGCLACGVLSFVRPAWASVLGLLETSANLLLLPLSLFLPYFALANRILDGEVVTENPITPGFVVNLILAGTVWVVLFYARAGLGGRRPAGLGF